jgi:hypothetical protein
MGCPFRYITGCPVEVTFVPAGSITMVLLNALYACPIAPRS